MIIHILLVVVVDNVVTQSVSAEHQLKSRISNQKLFEKSLQVVIVLEVSKRTYTRTQTIVDSPIENVLSWLVLTQL